MDIAFILSSAQHQRAWGSLMRKGIEAVEGSNAVCKMFTDNFDSANYDLCITWGHRRTHVYNHQRKCRKPYLIMERAYMGDRFKWTSLGFNGLNGQATFNNSDIVCDKRWEEHFKQYVKPWRIRESLPVLLIGQVPNDMSHRHINIQEWYLKIIKECNDKNIPVIFRKHPLDRSSTNFLNHSNLKYELDTCPSLEESLESARACITFSSNSAVVSVLEGIPTITYDPISMVYNHTPHSLDNLDYTFDRESWGIKMAYTQWLAEEIESGQAWKHLRSFI